MKKLITLTLFSLMLLQQSCMVMGYKLRNEIDHPAPEKIPEGELKYNISINGQSSWNYRSTPELPPADQREVEIEYGERTEKIFKKKNITAIETTDPADADFLAEICITPFAGGLPQEFLAGLTLYIIPSWGTRPTEFTYTFEQVGAKQPHSYYVDQKTYLHWVFLPVCWVSLITADETRYYKNALENYLENEMPEGITMEDHPHKGTRQVSISKYNTYIYVGKVALENKNWHEAERAYHRAMTQVKGGGLPDEYRAGVLYGLSEIKIETGLFKEATTLLEEAMQYDTELPEGLERMESRAGLSNAYYEQGKTNAAAQVFDQVLQIAESLSDAGDVNSINTLTHLAADFHEHGRYSEGVQILQTIDRLYPSNSDQMRLQARKELKEICNKYIVTLRKNGDEQTAAEFETFVERIKLIRQSSASMKAAGTESDTPVASQ